MTTNANTSISKLERANKFLKSVQEHIEKDSGDKADLKRALSGEERHLRNAYFVLRYLRDIEWQQDVWIFVAALSAFYPQEIRTEQRNFGSSCWGLAVEINKTGESKGTARKFKALLDNSFTDIQSPLTNLVRHMKSKDIRVDYSKLLVDLLKWEHPSQYINIQDEWARSFWGAAPSNMENPIDPPIEPTEIDN
jgi:CRISPR system Cascade subunit CasB